MSKEAQGAFKSAAQTYSKVKALKELGFHVGGIGLFGRLSVSDVFICTFWRSGGTTMPEEPRPTWSKSKILCKIGGLLSTLRVPKYHHRKALDLMTKCVTCFCWGHGNNVQTTNRSGDD